LANPRFDGVDIKTIRFDGEDKSNRVCFGGSQFQAIHNQERFRDGRSRALVAAYLRMIFDKAEIQRRGLTNEVGIFKSRRL
jgi:hypothetical protein